MADRSAFGLRVVLVNELGQAARARGLAGWLCGVAPSRARGLVTIALVSDDAMRRMNRRYLGKNRPTDVLSFPARPAEARSAKAAWRTHDGRRVRGASAGKPGWVEHGAASAGLGAEARLPGGARARAARPVGDRALGDIAIATGVARHQARRAGHSYARELRVLALHGLLHLLGYDHEADQGRMARLEARLRRRGGLAAGVIERAGRP
jgi:probable rRNA maturation factor